MFRAVLSLLIAVLFWIGGHAHAKEPTPLKVIAPDVVVESFEFGKYPSGKDPHAVDATKVKFIPVPSLIASEEGYFYGYRLKLKTTRTKVFLNQAFGKSAKGLGWYAKPNNGIIYEEWLLDGVRNGKRSVMVWVEGVELPPLVYTVKYRYND